MANLPLDPEPRRPGMARIPLDARRLEVRFVASLGPLKVRGRFGDVQGTVQLPDGLAAATGASGTSASMAGASITVRVAAASIDTGLAMRDRHLRGPSFLHAAEHAHVAFRSHQLHGDAGDLLVTGALTLRGVAREITVRVALAREAATPDAAIAARASFDVDIRSFGVGLPRGGDVLNPIFRLIGRTVQVELRLVLPAGDAPPAPLSGRGR